MDFYSHAGIIPVFEIITPKFSRELLSARTSTHVLNCC